MLTDIFLSANIQFIYYLSGYSRWKNIKFSTSTYRIGLLDNTTSLTHIQSTQLVQQYNQPGYIIRIPSYYNLDNECDIIFWFIGGQEKTVRKYTILKEIILHFGYLIYIRINIVRTHIYIYERIQCILHCSNIFFFFFFRWCM